MHTVIQLHDNLAVRDYFSSFSDVSTLNVQMKKALVRALSSAKGSVYPFTYSGYLPLLFLLDALRGLSFLASPLPLVFLM
jgi:hypothetical protein